MRLTELVRRVIATFTPSSTPTPTNRLTDAPPRPVEPAEEPINPEAMRLAHRLQADGLLLPIEAKTAREIFLTFMPEGHSVDGLTGAQCAMIIFGATTSEALDRGLAQMALGVPLGRHFSQADRLAAQSELRGRQSVVQAAFPSKNGLFAVDGMTGASPAIGNRHAPADRNPGLMTALFGGARPPSEWSLEDRAKVRNAIHAISTVFPPHSSDGNIPVQNGPDGMILAKSIMQAAGATRGAEVLDAVADAQSATGVLDLVVTDRASGGLGSVDRAFVIEHAMTQRQEARLGVE